MSMCLCVEGLCTCMYGVNVCDMFLCLCACLHEYVCAYMYVNMLVYMCICKCSVSVLFVSCVPTGLHAYRGSTRPLNYIFCSTRNYILRQCIGWPHCPWTCSVAQPCLKFIILVFIFLSSYNYRFEPEVLAILFLLVKIYWIKFLSHLYINCPLLCLWYCGRVE